MGTIKSHTSKRRQHRYFKGLAALAAFIAVLAWFAICDMMSVVNDWETSLLNLASNNNAAIQRRIYDKIPPVSCSQVLQQFRSGQQADPNRGKLLARYTITDPPFWASFHTKEYDRVRYSAFEHGKYYEMKLSEAFAGILSTQTQNGQAHHVIDVGGNIGWFSLLAASHGAHVSTFEPNAKNCLRMCESMCLNGWLPCGRSKGCLDPGEPKNAQEEVNRNIHIYPYGIAEKEGELYFETNERNPGESKVIDHKTNETEPLRVVSLDGMAKELGWFESDVSILKVDVEGKELGVFLGAKELLRSRRVKNLFMEGSVKGNDQVQDFKATALLLIESGFEIFRQGGFRGPEHGIVPPEEGASIIDHYYQICSGGKTRAQCNLWWKPRES